jgi:hypothetical protein
MNSEKVELRVSMGGPTKCFLKNIAEGGHLRQLSVDGGSSYRIGHIGVNWIKVADDTVQLRDYFNRVYSP